MRTPESYLKVAESEYLYLELGNLYFNTLLGDLFAPTHSGPPILSSLPATETGTIFVLPNTDMLGIEPHDSQSPPYSTV